MTRPTAVDVDELLPEQQAPALDDTSALWLSSLRSTGAERDGPIAELHALLLRAARFETVRRGGRDARAKPSARDHRARGRGVGRHRQNGAGLVLACREQEYVIAARALGASGPRIVRTEILPNVVGPVLVLASLELGTVIRASPG